ncbi:hypothetical protein SDC9_122833 [bioreactor metagenome]|uniref:Uncharacterized protein n=1 Tax=bioreactor metagenome TaxID=1076179 RepID=A0A645CFS2_9ZZZZ
MGSVIVVDNFYLAQIKIDELCEFFNFTFVPNQYGANKSVLHSGFERLQYRFVLCRCDSNSSLGFLLGFFCKLS